jgi:hypothetical protein
MLLSPSLSWGLVDQHRLRGIDRSEGAPKKNIVTWPSRRTCYLSLVKEKSAVAKSMMASKNLPRPITKLSEGPHWLRVLAAELALRLNEAREADPSMWPKTIVLHARPRMIPIICVPCTSFDGLRIWQATKRPDQNRLLFHSRELSP